jgi:hypothetical protein
VRNRAGSDVIICAADIALLCDRNRMHRLHNKCVPGLMISPGACASTRFATQAALFQRGATARGARVGVHCCSNGCRRRLRGTPFTSQCHELDLVPSSCDPPPGNPRRKKTDNHPLAKLASAVRARLGRVGLPLTAADLTVAVMMSGRPPSASGSSAAARCRGLRERLRARSCTTMLGVRDVGRMRIRHAGDQLLDGEREQ